MSMNDPDAHIRAAAFSAMEKLVYNQPDGFVPWDVISQGFQVGTEHILFANQPRGIFKPKQMTAALSIKTTFPREGRPTWYSDQGLASSKLDYATGLLHYDLARGGLNDPTNRALQMAMSRSAPLIYFIGVREGTYQPVFPVWVEEFDLEAGHVLLATTDINESHLSSVAAVRNNLPLSVETSWTLRTVLGEESPSVVQYANKSSLPMAVCISVDYRHVNFLSVHTSFQMLKTVRHRFATVFVCRPFTTRRLIRILSE